MTHEDVISWLEYLSDEARSKADGLVPTNIEIAFGMAIDALKAQEPRVLTLDEVKHFVYGNPYIIEMVLSNGEYRLMDGLFSHQGVVGNCDFVTVNERIRLYDADYGKTWRAWTGRPSAEQRWQP